MKLRKVTVGFVVQEFELVGDRYVCVGQDFVCGDDVTWETSSGEVVDCPGNDDYQPYLMVQPEVPCVLVDVGDEDLVGDDYEVEFQRELEGLDALDALDLLDEELEGERLEERRRDEKRGLYPDALDLLDEERLEERRRDEKRGLYPDVDDSCN